MSDEARIISSDHEDIAIGEQQRPAVERLMAVWARDWQGVKIQGLASAR